MELLSLRVPLAEELKQMQEKLRLLKLVTMVDNLEECVQDFVFIECVHAMELEGAHHA